jgi:Multicopper oxidase
MDICKVALCSCYKRILSVDFRYDVDDGWYIHFPPLSSIQLSTSRQSQPLLHLQIGPSSISLLVMLIDYCPSRYHTPAPSAGTIPTTDSALINGLGRYATGPTSPLAIISVIQGRRYRFRLVSISCDPNYIFSIDGHTMVCYIFIFIGPVLIISTM